MKIPEWNLWGVIPPVRDTPGNVRHLPENRSPYKATFTEVVQRFATTPERVILLKGLLDYREALYNAGIRRGFQWMDGSFVEHVETHGNWDAERTPTDIDVITFFYPPAGKPLEHGDLFDPELTQRNYGVDTYAVTLGTPLTEHLVETIAYWYGMWSLRKRDNQAKGFVQVELDPDHDHEAREALKEANR